MIDRSVRLADVLFHEDVLLADIAGDLVGVEHPMYPRDHEVSPCHMCTVVRVWHRMLAS